MLTQIDRPTPTQVLTLAQLKAKATESGLTPDQVRQFGKLTCKATWEAAIASVQPQVKTVEVEVPVLANEAAYFDKAAAAKVLSWDRFLYGTDMAFTANDILFIRVNEDIIWYRLANGGAIPISFDQFDRYWSSIQKLESGASTEPEVQTEMDVIEMEVNGVVETRMGWIEEDWEGCRIYQIMFEKQDDQAAWLLHYQKIAGRVEYVDPEEQLEIELDRAYDWISLINSMGGVKSP